MIDIGIIIVGSILTFMIVVWLSIAITSYIELSLDMNTRQPIFWRWILPWYGNSDWFYHDEAHQAKRLAKWREGK